MKILGYSLNTFDEYLHTVTWGHVLCDVEIRQSTFNQNTTGSTNPKNAVKHRIASYNNRSSMRISSVQSEVLTSESFQIRSKGTANEEAEGEKLLKDKCGIGHSTTSHALATKRSQASDRSDE
jgi:hypothetical protein